MINFVKSFSGGGGWTFCFLLLRFFSLCEDGGLLHPYEAFFTLYGKVFFFSGGGAFFFHAGAFYLIRGDISWGIVPFSLAKISAGTQTSAGTHAWLLCIIEVKKIEVKKD